MEHKPTPDIFISYCSKDVDLAKMLLGYLENNGLDCWIAPRNISGGDSWASAITKALQQCCVMILVYSSASNNSPAVLNEVTLATDRNMYIIPIRIEDVELSDDLKFHLASRHWQNAFENPKQQLHEIAQEIRIIVNRMKNRIDDPATYKPPIGRRSLLRSTLVISASACVVVFLVLAYRFNFVVQNTSEATPRPASPVQAPAQPASIPTLPTPPTPKAADKPAPIVAEAVTPAPVAPRPAVADLPQYASLAPAKPLASPGEKRLPSDLNARMVKFVVDHYTKYNYGSASAVMESYAPSIDYFKTPQKSKAALSGELANFFDRWQLRRSRFLDDFTIEDTPDPTIKKVHFSYVFYRERSPEAKSKIMATGYYKSPNDNRWCSSGTANDTLTLKIQDNALSIVGENQNTIALDNPKNSCRPIP